ncbi:hypothetical protein [Capybara microvirus Cap3_SP_668]|nr:hypothetical protein [Capybara microvirus Cap3_SP_668]
MEVINIFQYVPSEGTSFTEPSQCIPDQTLSVQELLARFSRGYSVDVPIHDDYESYEDSFEEDAIDGIQDLSDVDILREQIHMQKKLAQTSDVMISEVTDKERSDAKGNDESSAS